MVHPVIRAPYHGALELVPRLMLSGILVNTSLGWGHFVIDLNNALCGAIGQATLPAWQRADTATQALVDVIAGLIGRSTATSSQSRERLLAAPASVVWPVEEKAR